MKKGDVVKFIGSTIEQTRWGDNDDPNLHLEVGSTYKINIVKEHTCHTKITLEDFPNLQFNSVCFKLITKDF
jgi:hypothetical protein